MPDLFPHRTYPCNECPIRADNADNPRSKFPAERWDALSVTVCDPETDRQPGMGEILFGCHKGEPGTDADLACAGWLAQFGADHLAVRLAVAMKRLPVAALQPGENWPPLHETWADQFQAQIDLLTDRFTSLAGRAPALRDMDRQVADVERRRAPVAVEVGWRRGVAMRVKWPVGAVLALALAVLGVASGWSWVAVLVVVVVAVGCGTRAWGARNLRLQAECELCSLDRELEDLRERQAQLRSGAPVVVAVAQRDRV